MAELTERTEVDQITTDQYGNVMVRQRTDILRGKEVVHSSYHRLSYGPQDDLKGADKRVKAIAEIARKDAKPVPETEE